MSRSNPPAYSKEQINQAGDEIRNGNPSEEAIIIVNKWRSSHGYILNTFQAILRNRTQNTKIAVAQRHKRFRTIMLKLERFPKLQLSRMNDIAGCRLIFPDNKSLKDFREKLHSAKFAHKLKNAVDKYDYLTKPKEDGYRGIHDIYEYNASSEKGKAYKGLLLELQYRTIYQHAWATTVEIVGMITENQPKFHTGDKRHIEFFRLASEIIARAFEGSTSSYPELSHQELLQKFYSLDNEIHIIQILKDLNKSQKKLGSKKNVILFLSGAGNERNLEIYDFVKRKDALKKYFELEKQQAGADIVFVKADTAKDIQLSYKNYFNDPNDFLNYIEEGCKKLSQS